MWPGSRLGNSQALSSQVQELWLLWWQQARAGLCWGAGGFGVFREWVLKGAVLGNASGSSAGAALLRVSVCSG